MTWTPNSIGRLAHLTDDEILVDRILKTLSHYSINIKNSRAFDQDVLASPVWALARIGTFTFMRW